MQPLPQSRFKIFYHPQIFPFVYLQSTIYLPHLTSICHISKINITKVCSTSHVKLCVSTRENKTKIHKQTNMDRRNKNRHTNSVYLAIFQDACLLMTSTFPDDVRKGFYFIILIFKIFTDSSGQGMSFKVILFCS